MSPVSPVFHTELTVSIDLKNIEYRDIEYNKVPLALDDFMGRLMTRPFAPLELRLDGWMDL